MKRVRTVEDIVFEQPDQNVTLAKGEVYSVYEVLESSIMLLSPDGELLAIDLPTFEAGFEAVG